MKNAMRRTGALVASALLVAGLAACGGNGEPDAVETPTAEATAEPETPETPASGDTDEMLTEIIAGCLAEAPGQEAYCECAAVWIADRFTADDLETMSLNDLSGAMIEAAMDCLHLMDLGALDLDLGALGDLSGMGLSAAEEAFWADYFESGMAACLAEAPGQELYCECSLELVFEAFTMDELTAMNMEELTEVSIAAAMECMDLLDIGSMHTTDASST